MECEGYPVKSPVDKLTSLGTVLRVELRVGVLGIRPSVTCSITLLCPAPSQRFPRPHPQRIIMIDNFFHMLIYSS